MKRIFLLTLALPLSTLAADGGSSMGPARVPDAASAAQLAAAARAQIPQIIEARKRADQVEIDEDTGLEGELESLSGAEVN